MRTLALYLITVSCFPPVSQALSTPECDYAQAFPLTPQSAPVDCTKVSPAEQIRCLDQELRGLRLELRALRCLMEPQLRQMRERIEPAHDKH